MGSLGPELTLSSRFSSEITDVFFSRIEPEKISELETYVQGLQDEMKKIDAFKRDLPIIIVLLEQVIMQLHAKLAMCKRSVSVSEPVLEEFIPIKSSSSDEDEMMKEMDDKSQNNDNNTKNENEIVTSTDKRDWMSSVQLWSSDDNQNRCPNTSLRSDSIRPGLKLEENTDKKKPEEDIKWPMMGALNPHIGEKAPERTAFTPFKRPSSIPVMVRKEDEVELPKVPGLSLCTPEMKKLILREEVMCNGFNSKSCSAGSSSGNNVQAVSLLHANSQSHSARKQRRCWSPELHRRFVNALQQLGGAQVATPKQIRELMQVDGLTNDEVKSHLQKYRLHSRKSDGKKSYTGPLDLWPSAEPCGESSKPSTSQSGSPPGPLELTGSRDTSMMTLSMGDEYDEKNESSWKTQIHLCG